MFFLSNPTTLLTGLGILTSPLLVCSVYAVYSRFGQESDRTTRWLRFRQLSRLLVPLSIAGWWALWTYSSGDEICGDFSIFVFPLPLVTLTLAFLASGFMGRVFLQSKWRPSDILRTTFWRNVELTIPLLLVAGSFDALVAGRWRGLFGLVLAAASALLGRIQSRIAEGVKLQPVSSGETYKRAAHLARRCEIKLDKIFIVPSGPGRLTNAYGGSGFVAVTDNFGEYLNQAELDATIGHELGHVKRRHGRRTLRAMAITYSVTIGALLWPARTWPSVRPVLDLVIVLAPILFSNYLSRRFEFEADRYGLAVSGSAETSIRALALMCRKAGGLADCNPVVELFMTHPSLKRRAEKFALAGGVERAVAYKILAETGFRNYMPVTPRPTAPVTK